MPYLVPFMVPGWLYVRPCGARCCLAFTWCHPETSPMELGARGGAVLRAQHQFPAEHSPSRAGQLSSMSLLTAQGQGCLGTFPPLQPALAGGCCFVSPQGSCCGGLL